jgi:drug/metabolite transporter (DMT)-like permease
MMRLIVLSVSVIAGMAAGQILFKLAARGTVVDILTSSSFWAAACLYGVVTVLWVLLLREMDLARAYPLMAATYVLVPLAAGVVFGETFGPLYGVGVIFIVVGIVLTRFG